MYKIQIRGFTVLAASTQKDVVKEASIRRITLFKRLTPRALARHLECVKEKQRNFSSGKLTLTKIRSQRERSK